MQSWAVLVEVLVQKEYQHLLFQDQNSIDEFEKKKNLNWIIDLKIGPTGSPQPSQNQTVLCPHKK